MLFYFVKENEKGLLDKVGVYGVDASPDSKALIKEGMMEATAAQFPSKIGKKTADNIYLLLQGKPVEPYTYIPVELVDRTNVDEYGVERWQQEFAYEKGRYITKSICVYEALKFIDSCIYWSCNHIQCVWLHKKSRCFGIFEFCKKLPLEQWRIVTLSIGFYICLLILLSYKCKNNVELFAKIVLEIVIGVIICDTIYFGYAGVILLILADAIQYAQNMQRRLLVILAACVIYLLLDADLISIVYPVVPLETMWIYYDAQSTIFLFAILKILNALNLFVFIYYMVVLILDQMSEKKRILALNEELEKKNEQLLEYAKEMEVVTQTKERNRLAREIHGTLGHALTGIITGLDACITLIDKVIAFGDQELDIEMLTEAGLSVAMGNAPESIKKIADVITKSNEEDGVAIALEKYVLN